MDCNFIHYSRSRTTAYSIYENASVTPDCGLPLNAELFVTSRNSHQVLRYNETNGTFIDIFIPNLDNRFKGPSGITFGPDNNLYIACIGDETSEKGGIFRYNGQTGDFIDKFTSAYRPVGLIFRNRDLFVSHDTDTVSRFNAFTGNFSDYVITASIVFMAPRDLAFGPTGDLYVTGGIGRVMRFPGFQVFIQRHTSIGDPFGLRFLPSTETSEAKLIVSSGNESKIKKYDPVTGEYKGDFASTNLNYPAGIEIGPDQNVYVASNGDDRIVRFNARTGEYMDDFVPAGSGGLDGPMFMTFRPVPIPVLSVTHSGQNLVISWPVNGAANFQLFEASTAAFADEQVFPGTVTTTSESNVVTTPISGETALFRLKSP